MQLHKFGRITRGDHQDYLCNITQADDETFNLVVFKDEGQQNSPVISECLPDLEAVNAFMRAHDWEIKWPDSQDIPEQLRAE